MASFNEIVNQDKPVLVDFHATWCGPCKMMEPMIKELKSKVGDKAAVIKIDVDKNQSLAAKLRVQGVPTLMLYKEGKVVWRDSGVQSVRFLEDLINKHT